jgi:hypothetical protein
MRLFEDHIKQNNTESRKRNTRQYIIGHFKIKTFIWRIMGAVMNA